jgi:hypothetical protein
MAGLAALLPEADWSYDEELVSESLHRKFILVSDQLRADETKKMVKHIKVCLN